MRPSRPVSCLRVGLCCTRAWQLPLPPPLPCGPAPALRGRQAQSLPLWSSCPGWAQLLMPPGRSPCLQLCPGPHWGASVSCWGFVVCVGSPEGLLHPGAQRWGRRNPLESRLEEAWGLSSPAATCLGLWVGRG